MPWSRRVAAALAALAAGCAADSGAGSPRGAAGYDHADELATLVGKGDGVAPRKAWTVLLFGAADNDLESFILADVDELESIGSTNDVNFVAFVDTPQGAFRAYLLADDDRTTIGSPREELGEVDTGDPATLAEFVRWGLAAYPAERTAVIVSGHGGGVPREVAPDHGTGNALSPSELLEVLREHAGPVDRIDVVGADACLMQTIETAYELRYVAGFVVGSENTEPGSGWAYEPLGAELTSHPEHDGYDLGEAIARTFAHDVAATTPDYTLSLIRTTEFLRPPITGTGGELAQNVFSQLDALAAALRDRMATSPELVELVRSAVHGTFRYRGAGLAGAELDPYGDLDRFLFGLEATDDPEIRQRVDTLRATLHRLLPVVYVGAAADAAGARGLSIYLPLPESADAADLATYESSCDFCRETGWASFVEAYAMPFPE